MYLFSFWHCFASKKVVLREQNLRNSIQSEKDPSLINMFLECVNSHLSNSEQENNFVTSYLSINNNCNIYKVL